MPVVTFQPSGKSASMDPGTELLDAAKLANVEIATPCGGKGTCGKCLVRILSGEVESNSTEILSETEEKNAYVQACRTKVLDTPVTASIPEQVEIKEGISTDGFIDASLIRKELFPKSSQLAPLAFKLYAEVPEPQPEDGFSDIDRLTRSLQENCSKKLICCVITMVK
jgi:uncharacterized 2Fe-2S/4Fe-4S cluster protein (DUF4445 family)